MRTVVKVTFVSAAGATQAPLAIIDSSCTSGTSTLETHDSNFIARQLYAQKYLKYRTI